MKNDIYEIADKNNIAFLHADIDSNAYCYKECDTIIVNKKLQGTEEKMAVAEEVAHYEVGITPTLPSADDYYNKLIRSKNEFKAFKWMQGNLLPQDIEKLKYSSLWEIADEFCVTPEFVKRVIEYRKETNYGC